MASCHTKKVYAVAVGRIPGIYHSWPEAQAQVSGFAGARYKGHPTLAAAKAWLAGAPEGPLVEPPTDGSCLIYTDGSSKGGIAGYGVVVIPADRARYRLYGPVPVICGNPATNNIAELYAIKVALKAEKGDVILYTDSKYAIGCLTSWLPKWIRTDFAGIANADLIRSIVPLTGGRTVDFRHVAAHRGHPLNEEADRLADMGRCM